MNLYKFHKNPASLNHYEDSFEFVPKLVWEKYKDNKRELKKREDIWARDARCAYYFAKEVLKGPFPKGEDAIAKDTKMAYWYAKDIKGPFPKGEDAIAKDADFAYLYALNVLTGSFSKGENAILDSEHKNHYLELIGELK